MSVMYIGPRSRTERPRKTKIGTEVALITRDLETTFKVKGQLAGGGAYCGGLLHSLLNQQAFLSVQFICQHFFGVSQQIKVTCRANLSVQFVTVCIDVLFCFIVVLLYCSPTLQYNILAWNFSYCFHFIAK